MFQWSSKEIWTLIHGFKVKRDDKAYNAYNCEGAIQTCPSESLATLFTQYKKLLCSAGRNAYMCHGPWHTVTALLIPGPECSPQWPLLSAQCRLITPTHTHTRLTRGLTSTHCFPVMVHRRLQGCTHARRLIACSPQSRFLTPKALSLITHFQKCFYS